MVKVGSGSVMYQGLLETGQHVHMDFICTTLPTTIMTGSFLYYVHHSRQTQTPTVTCLQFSSIGGVRDDNASLIMECTTFNSEPCTSPFWGMVLL